MDIKKHISFIRIDEGGKETIYHLTSNIDFKLINNQKTNLIAGEDLLKNIKKNGLVTTDNPLSVKIHRPATVPHL